MLFSLLDGSTSGMIFAALISAATIAIWFALAPARPARTVTSRLDGFVDRSDLVDAADMERSFATRAVAPIVHRILQALGSLLPNRNLEKVNEVLLRAGSPGNLGPLDYVGLRIILGAAAGVGYYVAMGHSEPILVAMRNAVVAVFAGYMLPKFWLSQKVKKRRTEIARALPDALDMLTIGVEAGLAFESALLRVGDQWNNALSQEFRRVVSEMRVGVPRNEALRRMADRNGVEDLSTFVAVLIQSNMLGVSIAQVLHTQADQMRIKRRQHAEEQAHSATVKIVVVLVFFILPSLFIVILGPAVPRIAKMLQSVTVP